MEYLMLCGVNIAIGKREDFVFAAKALIGRGGAIFTPNPSILRIAKKNPDYARMLTDTGLNIPDGVGIRTLLRHRGKNTDVLPGVELGEQLVGGHSFAIIGGIAGVAERASERLTATYQNARCEFFCSGYDIDEEKIKSFLRFYKPELCFVCLGALKQELFIKRVMNESPRTLYLALGGAVDIYSGRLRRAPFLLRAFGLEWLWRTCREPRRIPRLLSDAVFLLSEILLF